MEAFQAASTDTGWKVPQGYVIIETLSGRKLESKRQELHLDDPHLTLNFALPETLSLSDITSIELRSAVEFAGIMPAEASEERLAVNNDSFRTWTPRLVWPALSLQMARPHKSRIHCRRHSECAGRH